MLSSFSQVTCLLHTQRCVPGQFLDSLQAAVHCGCSLQLWSVEICFFCTAFKAYSSPAPSQVIWSPSLRHTPNQRHWSAFLLNLADIHTFLKSVNAGEIKGIFASLQSFTGRSEH